MIAIMTVFISGPMSGFKDYNKPAFDEAEHFLTERGAIVLNPATLPVGLDDEDYLPIDIAMIDACDALYMLPGFENSRGAVAELAYGIRQGKEIYTNDGHGGIHKIIDTPTKIALHAIDNANRNNNVSVVGDTEQIKGTTTCACNFGEDDEFEGITWVELLRLYAKHKQDMTYEIKPWDDFGYAIAMRVEDFFGLNEDED